MRRACHDSLHIRAVGAYGRQQERDAAVLVARLLEEPGSWDRHFQMCANLGRDLRLTLTRCSLPSTGRQRLHRCTRHTVTS